MSTIAAHQQQVLEQADYRYWNTPISREAKRAFLETPRHTFVKRYRDWASSVWHEVDESNLDPHLPMLYSDRPLILYGDNDDNVPSTISQPSFALRMVDMLRLGRGHRVFELGAGSGWNAALMGHVVGPQGHVYSVEIIPEMAAHAQSAIARSGVRNVTIVHGDGGEGYEPGAPYDRATFMAGTYDVPRHFYTQIKNGGILLAVIKTEGGGDTLFSLVRVNDHFESVDSMTCGFVQMTGRYEQKALEPIPIDVCPEWKSLAQCEVARIRFWWGGKGEEGFLWRTLGIRSYLGLTDAAFQPFKTEKGMDGRPFEEHYFGLWGERRQSLVVAKDDWLIAYGDEQPLRRLLSAIDSWLALGMPSTACFGVHVYPSDKCLESELNQILIKREESQFLWTLESRHRTVSSDPADVWQS